ncbi:MAG: NAD(P)/FAD-dependent oxidoreductase [Lautropia sp.]
MTKSDVFHPSFKEEPYWWEAFRPEAEPAQEVPRHTRIAIVGGGYAGLSTALELAKQNVESVVLEARELGFGASTRNGGGVSPGINVGKSLTGRTIDLKSDRARSIVSEGFDAFSTLEDLIEQERFECQWLKCGRFVGAWTPEHFDQLARRIDTLNRIGHTDIRMLPRERQRDEIGSDFYYGGMVVERAATLHPSLYFKSLLDACRKRGVAICSQAPVNRIARHGTKWQVDTGRGSLSADEVVIATNGYTGKLTPLLQRRVIPIASHIIATEALPPDMIASLIPRRRVIADTKRVLCYYRISPDGTRMLFGGRPRFTQVTAKDSAPILRSYMIDRFPQLAGTRVTHAWTGNTAFTLDALPHMGKIEGMHYLMGCNGSGVAIMTHLGVQTARKIAGVTSDTSVYDTDEFPSHPLYNGNPWFLPLVGTWYRARDAFDRRMAELRFPRKASSSDELARPSA